jgi:hypothetical protein
VAPGNGSIKGRRHGFSGEMVARLEPHALTAEVIDDCQDAEPLSGRQLIGHEVDAPVLIDPYRGCRQDAQASRELLALFGADGQAFFSIHAQDALMIHDPAFTPQEHPQPTIAVAWARHR